MSFLTLVILLFISSSLISCKKQEPLCVEPLDGVAAYPCESRPSREPLSLQYSKVQSSLLYVDSINKYIFIFI